MFKKTENTDFNEAETIIGPSVKVEGDFVGQGNLIVDGTIKGNVKTNGNLKVGDKAKITASVEAKNALISGEIRGNVTITNDLELTENAKISGDIKAESIAIARGAMLNGNCTMEIASKTTKEKENSKEVMSEENKIGVENNTL